MGKMLDMPECDEADMYPEFSRGHHAAAIVPRKDAQIKTPTPGTGSKAFYDEPRLAGAAKVF